MKFRRFLCASAIAATALIGLGGGPAGAVTNNVSACLRGTAEWVTTVGAYEANGYVAWVATGELYPYHTLNNCNTRGSWWPQSYTDTWVTVQRWTYGQGWVVCASATSSGTGYSKATVVSSANQPAGCNSYNWPAGYTYISHGGSGWASGIGSYVSGAFYV